MESRFSNLQEKSGVKLQCLTDRDGAVGRALVSHQGVPGSIPGPGVICGLSLLLVLYSAPRGFSPGTPVFPSPQKPTFPNSNSILERTDISERVLAPPWCSMGKQITIHSYKRLSIGSRNGESTVSKSHRDMSVAVSCIL